MAWGGSAPSQTFSRTNGSHSGSTTWAQDSAAGTKITSPLHDTHDQDIADGLNLALLKNGGNTATADIPMGGFTLTNIDAAGARTEPARFSQVQDNAGQYIATVGGTADVITLTPTIAITSYAAGQRFTFIASGTNTTSVTVNVSAVGAKAIVRPDGSNTALSAGDIISGTIVDVEYDGTRFLLLNWATGSFAALNIAGATALTAPAADDTLPIYDLSATTNKKITLENFFKVIDGITADTSPDVADELVTYDASASAAKKTTITNFYKTINALTEDTSPDSSNDLVVTYDASASGAKKVKLTNILALVTGIPPAASAAEQETGTEAAKYVAPATQHRHPSTTKCWVQFNAAGTVAASYNTTSITDHGTGDWTVTIATDFSSAAYSGLAMTGINTTGCTISPLAISCKAQAAGTFRFLADNDPNTLDAIYAAFFGDHT